MPVNKPDEKRANVAYFMHISGYTFRDIAKSLNVDVKTAHRWIVYFRKGKLSTPITK